MKLKILLLAIPFLLQSCLTTTSTLNSVPKENKRTVSKDKQSDTLYKSLYKVNELRYYPELDNNKLVEPLYVNDKISLIDVINAPLYGGRWIMGNFDDGEVIQVIQDGFVNKNFKLVDDKLVLQGVYKADGIPFTINDYHYVLKDTGFDIYNSDLELVNTVTTHSLREFDQLGGHINLFDETLILRTNLDTFVWDLSDPLIPVLKGQLEAQKPHTRFKSSYLKENILYLVPEWDDFEVIDISTEVQYTKTDYSLKDIILENHVFIEDYNYNYYIGDTKYKIDKANFYGFQLIRNAKIMNNKIILFSREDIKVFDIDTQTITNKTFLSYEPIEIELDSDVLYSANSNVHLFYNRESSEYTVIDSSDAVSDVQRILFQSLGMGRVGDYFYTESQKHLYIIKKQENSFEIVNVLEMDLGHIRDYIIKDNKMVSLGLYTALWDLTDPVNPTILSSIKNQKSDIRGALVDNRYIIYGAYDSNMELCEITDDNEIIHLDSVKYDRPDYIFSGLKDSAYFPNKGFLKVKDKKLYLEEIDKRYTFYFSPDGTLAAQNRKSQIILYRVNEDSQLEELTKFNIPSSHTLTLTNDTIVAYPYKSQFAALEFKIEL